MTDWLSKGLSACLSQSLAVGTLGAWTHRPAFLYEAAPCWKHSMRHVAGVSSSLLTEGIRTPRFLQGFVAPEALWPCLMGTPLPGKGSPIILTSFIDHGD